MPTLRPDHYQRLVALFIPHMGDERARNALLTSALHACPVVNQIEWTGAAAVFVPNLIGTLDRYGACPGGEPALIAVLRELRMGVGGNWYAEIDALIDALSDAPLPAPAAVEIVLPSAPFIFISYSRKDTEFRDRVRADLRANDLRFWVDTDNLVPGTPDWEAAIRAALRGCAAVLYIASSAASASRFVRHELKLASNAQKLVVPAWAAGDVWEDCVPLGWDTIQHIDLRGAAYTPAAIARLAAALTGVTSPPSPLSVPERGDTAPAIRPVPPRPNSESAPSLPLSGPERGSGGEVLTPPLRMERGSQD
ncbi:MAG: TIR domain-containing protein, partial [Chloroflexota bacterium]|nr:TIR domain-containing protein [Chloroflexota bacterium]